MNVWLKLCGRNESVILLKKIAGLSVFVLIIFLVVELSYRFYVIGPLAFDLRKVNSMNTMLRSEFVQRSQYPDLYFELKPNMDGWFKGIPFSTNSAGLVDEEYVREKPEDVFRVAVVGSSWAMPTGVGREFAWHSLLEKHFNVDGATRKIEFINFGVEMYGLRDIVGTVRHKALNWQPDLVLVAVTGFTTSFVWEDIEQDKPLPPRAYPAFQSYMLRGIGGEIGLQISRPANDLPLVSPDDGKTRLNQLMRALNELGELSKSSSVPVAVLLMGYYSNGDKFDGRIRRVAESKTLTAIFVNRVFSTVSRREDYQIGRFDRHPNAQGHRLIADYLQDALVDEGLIEPATD